MAQLTRQIPGQNLLAGDERALLMERFGMEIYRKYFKMTKMKDKINVRPISNAKLDKFPVIGGGSAAYHLPTDDVPLHQAEHAEVKIEIDAKLMSAFLTDDLDMLLNHYDARSVYVDNCAKELAEAFDLNSIRSVAKATTGSHPLTGEQGGTVITDIDLSNASSAVNAETLYKNIKKASQLFTEYNIDPMSNDTWCMLTPADYYMLSEHLDMLNRDYGGSGSYNGGDLPVIWGIKVMHSNLFESGTDVDGTSDANYGTKYSVDMTDTRALIWNKDAVGCLQAMDVTTRSDYVPMKNADLFTAYQVHGWGTMIPSNAIQLSTYVTP